MWQIGLPLALLFSLELNRRFLGLKPLRPDAQTQVRPQAEDLLVGIAGLWAVATAAWAVVFVDALGHDWWLGALSAFGAATALIGPVGARNAVSSIRRLYGRADRHAANEAVQRIEKVSHDVAARARSSPALPGAAHAELMQAVVEFQQEAVERLASKKRRELVDAYHEAAAHEFEFYGNPLDFIRLWHNAGIEWLALNVTIILRAGLVASAYALPAGLTVGVAPDDGSAVPWALLVAWSSAMALAAPLAASIAMDQPKRLLRGVLIVELVLLAAALVTTPSWAVLASMAVVWNCANRLGEGFKWLSKGWLIGIAAALASTGALVAHGAGAPGALEAVIGLVVAALISASFTVFAPGSIFVATVIPVRAWFSRRAVRKDLGPFRERARTKAAAYLRAADEQAAAHPRAARAAIATALQIQRTLAEAPLSMSPEVVDTLDRLVEQQLAGSDLRFAGVDAETELHAARWRPRDGDTGLLMDAIEIVATEAAVHGRGDFKLALAVRGPELVITADNGRNGAVNEPRQGTTHLDAVVEALGAPRPPDRTHDEARWTVTFAVPASIVDLADVRE